MAQPPAKPPTQQQRPPQQQQQRPRTQEQTRARDTSAPSSPAQRPQVKVEEEAQVGVKTEQAVVVEGAGGAKNLNTEWVDVWLPGGKPMYIIVTTLAGNDLNVMI